MSNSPEDINIDVFEPSENINNTESVAPEEFGNEEQEALSDEPNSEAPDPVIPPVVLQKIKSTKPSRGKCAFSRLAPRIPCHLCGIRCRPNSLKNHIKFMHGELLVGCKICSKVFHRPDSAKKHVNVAHGIVGDEVKNYFEFVRKKDVPEESRPKVIAKSIMKAREIYPNDVTPKFKILPTIRAFNCHDCDGSFSTFPELLHHCDEHRVDEDGRKFSTLVPPRMRITA